MISRNLPLGTPPDCIIIPEALRSVPVAGSKIPARLRRLLHYAGIQCVGDLHGKRLSDFREFRGCGGQTLSWLKSMIVRALQPGAKPDTRAWPFTPNLRLEVPVTCGHLRLRDLPISSRLLAALNFQGIGTLGQLHGLYIRSLLRARNCGTETVAELGALLRRAEAGEFTFSERELASNAPADLLWLIDGLVSQLPERHRTVLALYFGATAEGRQTFREIGLRNGRTGTSVGQQLATAILWMLYQGNPKLRVLLGLVEGESARRQAPLSGELVSTWRDPARPFRYCPDFYVRLIPRLRLAAELPCGEPTEATPIEGNELLDPQGPGASPSSLGGRPTGWDGGRF
jgi:hypothetical protein